MPLVSDKCICLFKTEYSETSQILTLFARDHGLTRVIAKGAHRRTKAGASKFDGGVDLLEAGDAVFTHDSARELSTLTEWHLSEGHPGFRKNLRAFYLAMYAAELVGRLIEEHDPHPLLFDFLGRMLPELAGARREEAFLYFQLQLLRQTGYLPELSACVSCGNVSTNWRSVSFSSELSGIVCLDCDAAVHDRRELDVRLLRLLQGLLRTPATADGAPPRLPHLTRHQTDPLNRLLADHVERSVARRLKMRSCVLPPIPPRDAPVR